MTNLPESESFVLLRLSERRFALAAGDIAELVAPSRVFRFPHQTKEVEGVVVRRGRIVPVIDVAARLLGRRLTARRFYLIAQRRYTTGTEWIALPVTGDCELIFAEMIPASEAQDDHTPPAVVCQMCQSASSVPRTKASSLPSAFRASDAMLVRMPPSDA